MTEPTPPRAVYHDPRQRRPCCKCKYFAGDEWVFCDRPIKPEGLSTMHTINEFGTCAYWEKRDD